MNTRIITLCAIVSASVTGCTFDEGLEIHDLRGTVVIPGAAGERTFANGEVASADVRLIGPVYLGLYSGVEEGLVEYPHPSMGPAVVTGQVPDTYPYGGTSIGDFSFPCFEFLACKITSGRFEDYDQIIDWFDTYVNDPVIDDRGRAVQSGEFLRQVCLERQNYTSDEEIRLVSDEPQFTLNGNGDWESEFTIWQQEFVPGFSLWGWMDSPSELSNKYSTCNPADGLQVNEYTSNYQGGAQYFEVLNFPSTYISSGDYTVNYGEGAYNYIWESPEDEVEIVLDNLVGN